MCTAVCVRYWSASEGDIDPSFVITHGMVLDDAPGCYEAFKRKEDNRMKVVLTPTLSHDTKEQA